MSDWLSDHFSVSGATVVYDRPIACPGPLASEERAAVLATVGESDVSSKSFAICPTSWTVDEDIELLLRGLIAWDRASATDLTVVITGKGPLRDQFEQTLLVTSFRRTRVHTCFLPPEGYRQLLRACDFGFSLHRSASGVDLPMKIVDCFGAGLPVLAYHYGPCLHEQVVQGQTGLFFCDEAELAAGLTELTNPETCQRFRTEVSQRERATWADEWNRRVRPLLSWGKSESHHAG
jgi:beta-1,4-mannosyltransferase